MHASILKDFLDKEPTKDLEIVLGPMKTWTRAMPSADEMARYFTLAVAYRNCDAQLRFFAVEIVEAMLLLHQLQDYGPLWKHQIWMRLLLRRMQACLYMGSLVFAISAKTTNSARVAAKVPDKQSKSSNFSWAKR